MRRLAVLSLHTSPLAQPGTGDGGGMNVYVRELSSALARAGVVCDVFTRAWSDDLPPIVDIEPGLRVHHVSAGPPAPDGQGGPARRWSRSSPTACSSACRPPEASATDEDLPFDAVHANYWLSGVAGHTDQAPAEPAAGVHLPHPRPGQGRGQPRGGRGRRLRTSGPRPRPPSSGARTPCWPRARSRRPRSPSSTAPTRRASASWPPASTTPSSVPATGRQARRALGLPEHGPAAALRRAHPTPQGRRPWPCAPWPRSAPTTPTPGWSSSADRAGPTGDAEVERHRGAWSTSSGSAAGWSSCRPAPRAALHLLPGRRRLPGPEPVRVLRPGGPRGGGLRHPGGGLGRGRPAQPGRPRPHRLPGRGSDARGLRRLGPPDPGRAAAGRAAEHRSGPAGPPLHLGPGRPSAPRDLSPAFAARSPIWSLRLPTSVLASRNRPRVSPRKISRDFSKSCLRPTMIFGASPIRAFISSWVFYASSTRSVSRPWKNSSQSLETNRRGPRAPRPRPRPLARAARPRHARCLRRKRPLHPLSRQQLRPRAWRLLRLPARHNQLHRRHRRPRRHPPNFRRPFQRPPLPFRRLLRESLLARQKIHPAALLPRKWTRLKRRCKIKNFSGPWSSTSHAGRLKAASCVFSSPPKAARSLKCCSLATRWSVCAQC